ncbi:MAG: hypothetical protein GX376_01900 [Firmicutes bacterium]|nr:hypothetical protein [Bacillota bacterium]
MYVGRNSYRKRAKGLGPGAGRNLLWVLSLFFILWAGVAWGRDKLLQYNIETVIVEEGFVEGRCCGTGLLFTEELILTSPQDGIFQPLVAEGERVPAGMSIAQVVTVPDLEQTVASLGKVKERLEELQEENDIGRAAMEELVATQTVRLSDKIQELKKNLRAGQALQTPAIAEDLKVLLAERQRLLAELAQHRHFSQEEKETWLQEQERLEGLLRSATVSIEAPAAGVVSFYLFGAGERFTLGKMQEAGVSEFVAWEKLETIPQASKAGDRVKAGHPILRLVDNFNLNLAVVLPSEDIRLLENKRTGTIIFPELGQWEIDCPVVSSNIEADTGVIIYKLAAYRPELLRQRKLSVQIVGGRYQGLVIPRRALIKQEQGVGVYIKQKQRVVFQPLEVLGGNEDMVVVEGISPYEEVISNTAWVQEGQMIR